MSVQIEGPFVVSVQIEGPFVVSVQIEGLFGVSVQIERPFQSVVHFVVTFADLDYHSCKVVVVAD